MSAERLGAHRCRCDSPFGRCDRLRQHSGPHALLIGGGSDPVDDPEIWFAWQRRTLAPVGYVRRDDPRL